MQFPSELILRWIGFESAISSKKRAPRSNRGATHLYVKPNYLTLNAA